MLLDLFKQWFAPTPDVRHHLTLRSLIKREATVGSQLFGPVPKGHRREFFCLDENTWVWHEEWLDLDNKRHSVLTRYELRPNGVLKVQDGQPYRFASDEEVKNLLNAALLYYQQVSRQVYGKEPLPL